MTNLLKSLQSVQFLINNEGIKTGALLTMETWESLLDWLENQEDKAIVEQSLEKIKQTGDKIDQANWLDWDQVKNAWNED